MNPRFVSGRADEVWDDIRNGEWYAWLYAVHEAAELQAFTEIEANPFDPTAWRHNWQLPHLRATVFKLQYLRDWAKQLNIEVAELAIEQEHPIRSRYAAHHRHLRDVQALQQWSNPTEADLQTAIWFWRQIRTGQG